MGRRSKDDKKTKKRWNRIVNRFKGKLIKMIKDSSSKYDDYNISPKIRQVLLHWGYELTESDLNKKDEIIFFINIRHELLLV